MMTSLGPDSESASSASSVAIDNCEKVIAVWGTIFGL